MKSLIEDAARVLIGLPLRYTGRASTMQWFGFGDIITIPDEREGGTREIGEYALHVQCEWRIVGPDGIVVGSNDIYFPVGPDPLAEPPDFDYQVFGSNRRDERVLAFNALLEKQLPIVTEVWADEVGSLRLSLTGSYSLELFPNDTLRYEHWRLFKHGDTSSGSHFVVTGVGIED